MRFERGVERGGLWGFKLTDEIFETFQLWSVRQYLILLRISI